MKKSEISLDMHSERKLGVSVIVGGFGAVTLWKQRYHCRHTQWGHLDKRSDFHIFKFFSIKYHSFEGFTAYHLLGGQWLAHISSLLLKGTCMRLEIAIIIINKKKKEEMKLEGDMREARGSWWEGVSGSGANQNTLYITLKFSKNW